MPQPLLTVQLNEQKQTFDTLQEVAEFIGDAGDKFGWLVSNGKTSPAEKTGAKWAAHIRSMRLALGEAQKAEVDGDGKVLAETLDALKKTLANAFKYPGGEGFPTPGSRDGQFLVYVDKHYKQYSAQAAAAYLIRGINKEIDNGAEGYDLARLHKEDLLPGEANDAAKRMLGESQIALHEEQEKLKQVTRDHQDLLRDSVDDYEKLKARYKSIKELEEPATYWRTKRNWHWFGTVATVVAITAVAWWPGKWIWDRAVEASKRLTGSTENPEAIIQTADDWWKAIPTFAPSIIAAVAIFWLLRILVRIFMSQMHLANDASERVVMTKTYHALREKDGAIGDSHLTLVLENLFRKAATGIVHDDAAPQLLIEKLTRDK